MPRFHISSLGVLIGFDGIFTDPSMVGIFMGKIKEAVSRTPVDHDKWPSHILDRMLINAKIT